MRSVGLRYYVVVEIPPTPVPVLPFATPPVHEHELVIRANAEDGDGAQKENEAQIDQRGCHAASIARPTVGATKSSDDVTNHCIRIGSSLSLDPTYAAPARSRLLRSLGSSQRLRRRIDFGVTSSSSSSSM